MNSWNLGQPKKGAVAGGVIYIVNLALLILLIRFERNSNSDKTLLLTTLLFVGLLAFNLLCGVISQLDKRKYSKHFYYAALFLIVEAAVLSSI